jgi:hypothetical protein
MQERPDQPKKALSLEEEDVKQGKGDPTHK